MCRFKSGIILKDRVFIPDYDSHTDMLEELKIADTEDNAKRLFVRAELVPPDDDVFTPVSSWKYHVDQDILPDWYVTEVDEMRMREAVTEWAKEHIHIGEKIERIDSGTHWIKDCKVGNICGSAEVRRIYGSAEVGYIYDSAKVRCIYGSAKVGNIYDSAKVRCIYGSAKVGYIYGSATIEIFKYSIWKHIKSVGIKDKAILIDRYNNKIYHSGAFETVIVGGKKK